MIKWHEVTWYSRLGAVIVCFGFIPLLSFYAGQQYQKVISQESLLQQMYSQNTYVKAMAANLKPAPTVYTPGNLSPHEITSPDGAYTFFEYMMHQKEQCVFLVVNSHGEAIDMSNLLDFNTIRCSYGENDFYSGFYRWVNNATFVLNPDYKKLVIVDLANKKTTFFQAKDPSLLFRNVDSSLKHWIFQRGTEGGLVLLDSDGTTIKESSRAYDRNPLYDPVNNGFLFIGRSFNGSTVTVSFDFLSLDTMEITHILTTDPAAAPGHGCSPETILSSKPGEVILTRGCLTVGQKYIGVDGNIHIPLLMSVDKNTP